jgi:lipooligosaccharide transport system ATP-binding protein
MHRADAAVDVSALTKRYGNGCVALDRIDLAIAPGTVTAIIGANGSGKSTLVKILAGILRADDGTLRVLGADPAARSPASRAGIGYIAQGVELDPEMTGAETLRLFATLHGIPSSRIRSRIGELAEVFGLQEHLRRLVGSYSGGLRQRLHIAVSFIDDPELMLMDEPTAALDPAGRASVWQRIQRCRDLGRTLVVISHDTIEASRNCETIVLLHRGRVAAAGSPEELVARHASWTLHVQLASPAVDDSELLRIIGAPMTSGKNELRGNRLTMQFVETDAVAALWAKNAAIGRLEAAGEIVLGFRLDPPDLASVYFNLTGAGIAENSVPGPLSDSAAGNRRVGANGR